MMQATKAIAICAMCAVIVTGGAVQAEPVGTAFGYQGQLKEGGVPANGDYDFVFRLFNDPDVGAQVGGDVPVEDWSVTSGLFTVELDFGSGAFTGDTVWLEVAVRPGDSDAPHAVLSPRQPVAPAPYALYALGGPGGTGEYWAANGADIYNTNSGNVGIGTTSPGAKLHLVDTSSPRLWIDGNGLATPVLYFRGAAEYSRIQSGQDIRFNMGGGGWSDDVTITHTGNVGIGTTEPDTTLEVVSDATTPGIRITNTTSLSGARLELKGPTTMPNSLAILGAIGFFDASDVLAGEIAFSRAEVGPPIDQRWDQLSFFVGGDERMRITDTGNVGIGTTAPAATLQVANDGGTHAIQASSPETPIYAYRTSTSGTSPAVEGLCDSLATNATGIRGVITSTSPGPGSAAVRGVNNSTSGAGAGVWGSQDGGGVGVYGTAPNGTAILGAASGDSGTNYGVRGRSWSPDGYGVYGDCGVGTGVFGIAGSTSGVNFGVRGESASSAGYGGYFLNTSTDGTALYTRSAGAGPEDATLQVHNTQTNMGMAAYITSVGSWATAHIQNNGTGEVLWLQRSNRDGPFIVAYNGDTQQRVFTVHESGHTTVSVLEITGGADLSEQFQVSAPRKPKSGMLVCIDPQNPGELTVCSTPYDRTVAGVISGAGGVKPGMLMGQNGSIADGEHPVALAGRVWCLCTAKSSAIRPGDLLTTSEEPGHGMKVTDHTRAQGAVIGKAMSSLADGHGLVLVLVSLQ